MIGLAIYVVFYGLIIGTVVAILRREHKTEARERKLGEISRR